MRKLICFASIMIVGCGVGVETYSITPKLVINDCSYAVDQHKTTRIKISENMLDFGWHELSRFGESVGGREFKSRHAIHTMPDGFEMMVFESISFMGKTCDSIYLGQLKEE